MMKHEYFSIEAVRIKTAPQICWRIILLKERGKKDMKQLYSMLHGQSLIHALAVISAEWTVRAVRMTTENILKSRL